MDNEIKINIEEEITNINVEQNDITIELNQEPDFVLNLEKQGLQGDAGPQGPRGEQGERGPIGPQGEQGEKGDAGDNATIAVGSVEYGDDISVVNSGTPTNAVLDFVFPLGSGGLEIGDIGIAPLGIDETLGKRRYLNGQVIIQEQYQVFADKVKSAIVLYPNLACSEQEWQATATLSAFGQCGKFVVDDVAGTIRLPKITGFIQGLNDLASLGSLVEAGLPNITGSFGLNGGGGGEGYGSFRAISWWSHYHNADGQNNSAGMNFDASRSSSIYSNSDTVQPESIRYPYFIQVATGAETEDNIINEIELNNPYSLGDSKYSPLELNNISWLKSEGQWNSKATYPSFYDWALVNLNNGVEGFASSTDTYTDYDFVLNTSDETFRLPLLDGSEDLISDKYIDLTLGASGSTYTAPANGWVTIEKLSSTGGQYLRLVNIDAGIRVRTNNSQSVDQSGLIIPILKGQRYTVEYDYGGTTDVFRFIYAQGNGSLYFYVGETVQNANLINAGRIEEKLVNLIPDNSSLISGYPMPSGKYIDLTLNANGATYTAPANGWFYLWNNSGAGNPLTLYNTTTGFGVSLPYGNVGHAPRINLAVKKGDIVQANYTAPSGSTTYLSFYYAVGSESEV